MYRQEQDIKALFKKKPEWLFTTVVKRALLGLFISFLLLFSKRIPTQFSLDDKKILLDFMIGFYTLVAAVYGIAIMFYIKPDQDNPYFWALVLEIFGTSIVGISKFFGDALRRILQLALF